MSMDPLQGGTGARTQAGQPTWQRWRFRSILFRSNPRSPRKGRTMLRTLAIVLAAIGLAGCQRSDVVEFDKMVQFEPPPLYCYASLAVATCYRTPLSSSQ